MPTLLGRAPKDSYPELLKLNNTGAGVTSSLIAVQDGTGVNTPLQLSTTQIALNGAIWPTSVGTSGQVLTAGSNGTMSWVTPAPGGVTTFNTRSGAVTLTSSDVTTALTYTPVNPTALSTYAPLASPTLTGTPVAPTASAGTSTTQLATTAFVGTAITNANTAITSTYAPLVSPALTGTPTAPTASAGTNTTQVATTAFVATATSNARIAVNIQGNPLVSSETFYPVVRAFTLPANLTGSLAYGVFQTGSTTQTVNVMHYVGTSNSATQVGTITITSSSISYATTGGASVSFAIGDRLSYQFQSAALTLFAATLLGTWN
jgi:hypothetical protein